GRIGGPVRNRGHGRSDHAGLRCAAPRTQQPSRDQAGFCVSAGDGDGRGAGMTQLLLELMSEEIPARMQARAAEDLRRLVVDALKQQGLEVGRANAFATPRRLALMVDDVPERSPELAEERKGPRVTAPEAAIQGFLKSAGLASIKDA